MLVFDIETNGLLETVTKLWCICTIDSETEEAKDYSDTMLPWANYAGTLEDGLKALSAAPVLCGHNIIGYDIPALKKLYPDFTHGKLVDTLVWARLTWSDIKQSDFARFAKGTLPGKLIGSHSLEAYGYRLGELKGDYGKSENAWDQFTPEMLAYCSQDVRITLLLLRKLVSKATSQEAVDLEHRVAEIIQRQILHGVLFDVEAAQQLYVHLIGKREELKAKLQGVFHPWWVPKKVFTPKRDNKKMGYRQGCSLTPIVLTEFNPSSRQHIAYHLKRKYGWEPTAFTDKGEPMVDEGVLSKLPYPEASTLSEYLMIEKRIGQLAEGDQAWLKNVNPQTGRIHGGVITNGAVTGRMTHNRPNLAQVPAVGAPYGEECRSLFIVPKGRSQVGADASGLELRNLAHYMGRYDGGAYAKVILEGDIHSVNQAAAGLPTRAGAKRFIYAYLYGAGDATIGEIIGGTATEGRKIKAKFLKKTPALKSLKEAIDAAVKSKGHLVGLDGRILPIRSSHSALNTLLQSAGAVVMKKALVILDDKLQAMGLKNTSHSKTHYDYEFILNIHDEWQIECWPHLAETIGKAAVESIREAGEWYKFRCPLDGEYKIGINWKETH